MTALCSTPHTVTVVTPSISRSSANNVSEPDYVVAVGQATERQAIGMFQVLQGSKFVDSTGEKYLYNATFYTHDETLRENDMLTLPNDFPFYGGENYLVLSSEGKFGIDGDLDHVEVRLVREQKR